MWAVDAELQMFAYSIVCLSVCVFVNPAKTAEAFEMPFRMWSQGTMY